ncbi:Paladin [Danio rerio] [Rhizoctonia solani]|uniref:Paladin [Danio rerio] n=1 Tax=Rhizoctonia solani TaxID=456999 RepID=A0A0K6GCH0_9AGAM|nr:Paladin [Danio rerio] [Rhizoctonia solani]
MGHSRAVSGSGSLLLGSRKPAPPALDTGLLDNSPTLIRATATVVKTRSGTVLSRGCILKTDHYPTGRALDLDINLQGKQCAPNFRAPRGAAAALNVYGAAQPRVGGLRAILSILGCNPPKSSPDSPSISPLAKASRLPTKVGCVWFSTREEPVIYIAGRPYVLREASDPKTALQLSDRASNIEAIEDRLKADILAEAHRFGGLVLTHVEADSESLIPTWTSVDADSVKTPREVWQEAKEEGWNVEYHRIPITSDRAIEDNYLDAYLNVIKSVDPLETALVFHCGMGAVRTTFAMVSACLIRRKQLITRGFPDPFAKVAALTHDSVSTPAEIQASVTLQQVETQQELSKSLLRLTYLLQQSLPSANTQSAIELLLAQPTLMDNLRKAHMGNYGLILSLLGSLEGGLYVKKLADRVIDSCDHVANLREEILAHRVDYAVTSMDDKSRSAHILKAKRAMEKYYFTIAFAGYVEENENFNASFQEWMEARTEIWNQVGFMRKAGLRLGVFAPVADLSAISKGESVQAPKLAGGRVLGDEWTDHVVKNRSGIILREGMLLKSDMWKSERHDAGAETLRGATNFRNIPGTNIYALGQPNEEAIGAVVRRVKEDYPHVHKVAWINLREEPIIYVNGVAHCLRREGYSLRNMKDYGGISAGRLEILEDRLKNDVIAEVNSFQGRILLHTENADGSVLPIWDEADPKDIAVPKDTMSAQVEEIEIAYKRIPITSERPPDFSDIEALADVVIRTDSERTPIILNCQLGRGRSTVASIVVLLLQEWLKCGRGRAHARTPRRGKSMLSVPSREREPSESKSRLSYQIINNLLRVIRRGPDVKRIVDDAIDQCDQFLNLRESIEDARLQAEGSADEQQKKRFIQIGLHNLRKYFELIVFQSFLSENDPDTVRTFASFEEFVKSRPVIATFENELQVEGAKALKPLERSEREDAAFADDIQFVVANRSGSVLSASTILKSDFFSNLQKMSLPERIDGAANFRRKPLTLVLANNGSSGKFVCGSGMPTVDGLRRALARVDAGPDGKNVVFWTSLREEPVLYVAGGRPHVLRLVDKPLTNVEATGITTDVVEAMEVNLKKDIEREMIQFDGRVLLHDEVETQPGSFDITAQWEPVTIQDIMTPRDVFRLVVDEGYRVDYARLAITDEQAPLPDALDQLVHRVEAGLKVAGDLVFNCQMLCVSFSFSRVLIIDRRGRTTTGMVAACLISTVASCDVTVASQAEDESSTATSHYDPVDGSYEEEAYLRGEYKIILQLVGVLSYGKVAKRITDKAIDALADVQNLRKAIFDYKLKVDASDAGSMKQKKLMDLGVNYLYRYGTLIVLANYLIERRQRNITSSFPTWLKEHREITRLLGRRSLD